MILEHHSGRQWARYLHLAGSRNVISKLLCRSLSIVSSRNTAVIWWNHSSNLYRNWKCDILRQAMEDLKSVDDEELLDALNEHEYKILPTAEKLHQIIWEIAHKEIIQSPMYIIDCFKNGEGPVKGLCVDKDN